MGTGLSNLQLIEMDLLARPKKRMRIKSERYWWKYYRVDTEQLTCSCQDFKLVRGKHPESDPLRLCRHLRKALLLIAGVPKAALAPLVAERELPRRLYSHDDTLLIAHFPDNERICLYVRESLGSTGLRPYRRHCFDSRKSRWLLDDPAIQNQTIAEAFSEFMSALRRIE